MGNFNKSLKFDGPEIDPKSTKSVTKIKRRVSKAKEDKIDKVIDDRGSDLSEDEQVDNKGSHDRDKG